jgi:hypothetical protein
MGSGAFGKVFLVASKIFKKDGYENYKFPTTKFRQ